MRVIAVSDLHGNLPEIPACDLLLIAGDVCPVRDHSVGYQRQWLERKFARWIAGPRCRAERVVWIAGNHDFALELGEPRGRLAEVATYLQDSATEVEGLKIYGTPWTQAIGPWAFSLDEGPHTPATLPSGKPMPTLSDVFALIPIDTDILISHGPPRGVLDRTAEGEPCGSLALLRQLDLIRPRLAVFGHIHEAHGQILTRGRDGHRGSMIMANVSLLSRRYRVVNKPQVFEL